jgi:hypothetical protein
VARFFVATLKQIHGLPAIVKNNGGLILFAIYRGEKTPPNNHLTP